MEPRRQRVPRKATRRVGASAARTPPGDAAFDFPHIAELMEYGEITVGVLEPVGCVAIAADEDGTLAMLQLRKGETLLQLLTRLDQAIDKALTLGIFTDEINA